MAVAALQLNDQPEIRELLQVLKGNGLDKEYKEVETLVSYLDSMENRFGQMMNELKEIKEQIPQVQDSSIKDKVAKVMNESEKRVEDIGRKLREAKETVRERVKDTLKTFQESGIKALQKAVTTMKIPELLQGFEKMFHRGMESSSRSVDNILSVRTEIHAIGIHAKNLGGILTGKELQQDASMSAPDKGILFRIESAYRNMAKGFTVMEQATADTRKRLEQFLAQSKEQRPSVRAELNRLKSESEKNAAESTSPQKSQESTVREKYKQDVTL